MTKAVAQRKLSSKRKSCEYRGATREQLYTIEETAEYLKCSKHTIRNWIRDREIEFVKIKGLIRIPASAIEEESQCFPKMDKIVNSVLTDSS
jgi:excisionase family DNA binding protein|tara:strand:- start:223 stop:498 length:276 start_codon:yes stop_codon:yes gene_type:complete